MTIGYLVGAWDMDRGDLYTLTYVYVYGGFLLLGLAFGTIAWLTRRGVLLTGRRAVQENVLRYLHRTS